MHDNLISVELQTDVIAEAELDESVIRYWHCLGYFVLLQYLIGLAFCPFWWWFGRARMKRYHGSVTILLTKRSLYVEEGGICCHCVAKKQKTIPLRRIEEVTISQDWLQRCYGVRQLQVETAEQNQSCWGPKKSLVLSGIVDVDEFRRKILEQCHQKAEDGAGRSDRFGIQTSNNTGIVNSPTLEILSEIRDTLLVQSESKDREESTLEVLSEIRDTLLVRNESKDRKESTLEVLAEIRDTLIRSESKELNLDILDEIRDTLVRIESKGSKEMDLQVQA